MHPPKTPPSTASTLAPHAHPQHVMLTVVQGFLSGNARRAAAAIHQLCAPHARHASNTSTSSTTQPLDELVRRLDALEARVNDALQSRTGWQQELGSSSSETDSSSTSSSSTAGRMADKAAEVMDDSAADAVQRLHPALIKFLNSGYLLSQQQLRLRLMQVEWEGNLKLWAQRRGLAEFEQWLAEKGQQEGVSVEWSKLQALYKDPDDLSVLADNPRARTLAHAIITRATLDKQVETYRACSETAKQLSNVLESGQRTGASSLLGVLKKLLPIPAFLR